MNGHLRPRTKGAMHSLEHSNPAGITTKVCEAWANRATHLRHEGMESFMTTEAFPTETQGAPPDRWLSTWLGG